MGQPLMDRRGDARFTPPESCIDRATLRPGCAVLVVDFSAGGALVQAERPLRPGARVHFQVVTAVRTLALIARVLRCAVWTLNDRDGVIYRGALQFEHRCDLLRELQTLPGSALPAPNRHDGFGAGKPLPGSGSRIDADPARSVK